MFEIRVPLRSEEGLKHGHIVGEHEAMVKLGALDLMHFVGHPAEVDDVRELSENWVCPEDGCVMAFDYERKLPLNVQPDARQN
jgi:hypothetical protein